jgi:hypothetical protein
MTREMLFSNVMAGLVPAVSASDARSGIEIPGTRPGMMVQFDIAVRHSG